MDVHGDVLFDGIIAHGERRVDLGFKAFEVVDEVSFLHGHGLHLVSLCLLVNSIVVDSRIGIGCSDGFLGINGNLDFQRSSGMSDDFDSVGVDIEEGGDFVCEGAELVVGEE